MTKQASFKKLVRERMQKTGERYAAARAVLLRAGSRMQSADLTTQYPGLIPGYQDFGGVQGDTALLSRMFAHAGLRHPATGAPYSEAMLHGLCGGVGFLYAVFEYAGHPPILTVVMRSRSMPQTYLEPLFDRVGVVREVSRTTSDSVAEKALDAALAAGRPAMCVVDAARLPWSGVPPELAGGGPYYVGVIGADGDRLWIDDRALRPLSMDRASFAKARSTYVAAKRALSTVSLAAEPVDWRAALVEALRDTVRTLRDGDPSVPESFRVNCGFSGMEKWRKLLVDAKDKKGWPKVFAEKDRAFAGLRRAYDCLQHEYTAPAAGRPFYADFLDEAAALLERPALGEAAREFRRAGEHWRKMAEHCANAPDAALRKACELADQRSEALDEGDVETARSLGEQRRGLREQCKLGAAEAIATYSAMSTELAAAIEVERSAVGSIERALA